MVKQQGGWDDLAGVLLVSCHHALQRESAFDLPGPFSGWPGMSTRVRNSDLTVSLKFDGRREGFEKRDVKNGGCWVLAFIIGALRAKCLGQE